MNEHKYNDGMNIPQRNSERGAINGNLIAIILLILVIVLLAGLSIWLYIQYSDQKKNVDAKIFAAVAEAKLEQQEIDAAKFAEQEKQPNREFVGPDDYGRLTFSYPKTWSAYVANDASDGDDFEAYLNPVRVPPIQGKDARFALRVLIEDGDYGDAVSQYDDEVEDGELKSSTVNANGVTGTRFDGTFSKDIRGAVVIFKVRDKVVSIFTDANTFKPDFENIIKTIKFNQ